MMAQTNNMIFFSSVCPLVSLIASPKQPQSFIGLAHTNHMVNNVMMTINAKQTREISLRRMAKRRNTPMQNSRLDIDLRDYVSYDKSSYIFNPCKC